MLCGPASIGCVVQNTKQTFCLIYASSVYTQCVIFFSLSPCEAHQGTACNKQYQVLTRCQHIERHGKAFPFELNESTSPHNTRFCWMLPNRTLITGLTQVAGANWPKALHPHPDRILLPLMLSRSWHGWPQCSNQTCSTTKENCRCEKCALVL